MPSVPTYTKCASLGCKNTRSKLNSYCTQHGGKEWIDTEDRKQFNSMYQSAFWKQKRKTQLSIQPLCQACLVEGRVGIAQHIDHVFAWKAIGKQAFTNNLFQSLCAEHHSHKTALEQQGIYRHYSDSIKDYSLGDYQYILTLPSAHKDPWQAI
jgi:hypothetical protein